MRPPLGLVIKWRSCRLLCRSSLRTKRKTGERNSAVRSALRLLGQILWGCIVLFLTPHLGSSSSKIVRIDSNHLSAYLTLVVSPIRRILLCLRKRKINQRAQQRPIKFLSLTTCFLREHRFLQNGAVRMKQHNHASLNHILHHLLVHLRVKCSMKTSSQEDSRIKWASCST